MSDSDHDLATEFPEHKERIHALKTTNTHFKVLFDKYHEINKRVMAAERRSELLSEMEEEQLRKERLSLKDKLFMMLTA